MTLGLNDYNNITVLTGAGISVASGLPTYRGPRGLWNDPEKIALATAEAMAADPNRCWAMFSRLRELAAAAEPNAAHHALAHMERHGKNITIITQNVDGLHQRAGSKNVVELHGSIHRTRCCKCDLEPFEDSSPPADEAPPCPQCDAPLRAAVVLFGEVVGGEEHLAKRAIRDCDLFLAIGTSGTVSPASSFVRSAEYAGAHTVYINVEPMEPANSMFKQSILGPAEDILPRIAGL